MIYKFCCMILMYTLQIQSVHLNATESIHAFSAFLFYLAKVNKTIALKSCHKTCLQIKQGTWSIKNRTYFPYIIFKIWKQSFSHFYKKSYMQNDSYGLKCYMWINLLSVDRQKGRLAGFSLYVSNSDVKSPDDIKETTLCYKDGPDLPPLNLTKNCIEYGRYFIFYNERLGENVYPMEYEVTSVFTELCEVIIKGKQKPGVFNLNPVLF